MFVDILGRIQQWSGIVQNKLDICKSDIEALRKELIARLCEINALKAQLAQCEQQQEKHHKTAETSTEHATIIESAGVQDVSLLRSANNDSDRAHDPRVPDEREFQINEHQSHITSEAQDISHTDAAVQFCTKDKEKMSREIELEAEISRLRKENERILKDRAEYENAIQRALLRGVSSLNVEALRVLRCPPIPCCTPCTPCPASGGATELIVPCKSTKDYSALAMSKVCNGQRNSSAKSTGHERGSCTVKRPCASPCCSAGKSRKSTTNNSMVFLLHQGDTGNICAPNDAPIPRACGSPIMKKIEIPPCPRFNR